MGKKILFFCETITLAHIVRSLALAKVLQKNGYEVHFAANEIPIIVSSQLQGLKLHPLPCSVTAKEFLDALKLGRLPYSEAVVESQVAEDIRLIKQINPDLIVGDFRLSLLISARVCQTPFMNITNVTWHPSAQIARQVPDVPLARILGERLAKLAFASLQPIIFRRLAQPFNRVAKKYGQPNLGSLLDLYCGGDFVFYADHPELVKTESLPSGHYLGGAVLGHLDLEPDFDWGIPSEDPLVVVSLGSSGQYNVLPQILAGLSELKVQVLVSTAGQDLGLPTYPNIRVVDYLPLDEALKRADVFIGNGGSPSAYAAIRAGVPFIAIPSNLDQFNTSIAFVQRGVARRLRPELVNAETVKASVTSLLDDARIHSATQQMQKEICSFDATDYFCHLVEQILLGRRPTREALLAQMRGSPHPPRSSEGPVGSG